MILAFNNISALRQQLPLATRVHGYIVNGGSAANIIPSGPKYFLADNPEIIRKAFSLFVL